MLSVKFLDRSMERLAAAILLLAFWGCGSDGMGVGTQNARTSSGAYQCRLVWPPQIPRLNATGGENLHTSSIQGGIDCKAVGIAEVSFRFFSQDRQELLSHSWPCDAHTGRVSGLPSATGVTVEIAALDSYGMALLEGEDQDVALEVGITTTGGDIAMTPVNTPRITAGNDPKMLSFDWGEIDFPPNVDHYRIEVRPDAASVFKPATGAGNIPTTSHMLTVPLHLTDWAKTRYRVAAQDSVGKVVAVSGQTALPGEVDPLNLVGYFKSDAPTEDQYFGKTVAISGDGGTLAVGTSDDTVYLYTRNSEGNWGPPDTLSPGTTERIGFGCSISLSYDGDILAVGALGADNEGDVYVFRRDGVRAWHQTTVSTTNIEFYERGRFGYQVELSADGETMAVTTGEGYFDSDEYGDYVSGVYVFRRLNDDLWEPQSGFLTPFDESSMDYSGIDISLSADGNILAVGTPGDTTTEIVRPGDNRTDFATLGAVHIYTRSADDQWRHSIRLQAENVDQDDYFGAVVSLSADGNILAVGASAEDGAGGFSGDNSISNSGAVYIFSRTSDNNWQQEAYIKADRVSESDFFGYDLDLSASGDILVVDSEYGQNNVGAIYVYRRKEDSQWQQTACIQASNPDAGDFFGDSLALSAEGETLAVGALGEDSGDGRPEDNSAENAGAVYLF